ncbi:MAG: hypothetical protein AAF383_12970 [Cyanobacteria bacterium P01_A01_bin.83]
MPAIKYDLVIGNFEFDFANYELRYKTIINFKGDRLTLALIKQAVCLNAPYI